MLKNIVNGNSDIENIARNQGILPLIIKKYLEEKTIKNIFTLCSQGINRSNSMRALLLNELEESVEIKTLARDHIPGMDFILFSSNPANENDSEEFIKCFGRNRILQETCNILDVNNNFIYYEKGNDDYNNYCQKFIQHFRKLEGKTLIIALVQLEPQHIQILNHSFKDVCILQYEVIDYIFHPDPKSELTNYQQMKSALKQIISVENEKNEKNEKSDIDNLIDIINNTEQKLRERIVRRFQNIYACKFQSLGFDLTNTEKYYFIKNSIDEISKFLNLSQDQNILLEKITNDKNLLSSLTESSYHQTIINKSEMDKLVILIKNTEDVFKQKISRRFETIYASYFGDLKDFLNSAEKEQISKNSMKEISEFLNLSKVQVDELEKLVKDETKLKDILNF